MSKEILNIKEKLQRADADFGKPELAADMVERVRNGIRIEPAYSSPWYQSQLISAIAACLIVGIGLTQFALRDRGADPTVYSPGTYTIDLTPQTQAAQAYDQQLKLIDAQLARYEREEKLSDMEIRLARLEAANNSITDAVSNVAEYLYKQGRHYEESGQVDKSRDYYKQVASQYPQTLWGKKAELILK